MVIDAEMLEAMREVDELTPSVPPIAPKYGYEYALRMAKLKALRERHEPGSICDCELCMKRPWRSWSA